MMLWDVTSDPIRPYFPGTVPVSWIKNSSVLGFFFSKSLNVNVSDKEYGNFCFSRGGNPTGSRNAVRWAGWQSVELPLIMLYGQLFRVLVDNLLFPLIHQSLINY